MKFTIEDIEDQVPILGYVKIGGRRRLEGKNSVGRARTVPVKYDHFVVTGTDQDELGYIVDDELTRKLLADQMGILIAEHTEAIYDENNTLIKTIQTMSDKQLAEDNQRLTRIVVILPFDKVEDNLVTSLAVYDGDGCRCRGNNRIAEYIDNKTSKVHQVRCPCNLLTTRLTANDEIDKRHPHEKGLKPVPGKGMICKANGELRLIIKQARTIGGLYIFRTTSINSIKQLMFSMHFISNMTGGFLAGIPLVLELKAKKVSPGPNKKPQTAYVVMLTRKQADENLFLTQVIKSSGLRENLRKQLASKNFEALPAPGRESPYDAYNIKEEFYAPETEVEVIGEVISDAEFTEGPYVADETPSEAQIEQAQEQPQEPVGAPPALPAATEAAPQERATGEAPAVQDTQPLVKEPELSAAEEMAKLGAEAFNASSSAEPNSTVVTFGRFKPIDTKTPDDADTSPASKELRKDFFEKTKTAGYTDEEVRNLLERLWKIQSSSKLQTWQVHALIAAL